MSLNAGSLDKGAQGGSGTGGTVANPTNIQLRVIPYAEHLLQSLVPSGLALIPVDSSNVENQGDLQIFSNLQVQLPAGRKYFLMLPVKHHDRDLTVSLVTTPSGSVVTDWESTALRYHSEAREGVIFTILDLSEATSPEAVLLRVQNIQTTNVSGTLEAMALFILDIDNA